MTPLRALFVMSVRQSLPLRRTVVLLLIQLAPTGIFLLSTANRTTAAGTEALVEIGGATLFALAIPVVSIVLGSSTFGVERRDQTLSFIALRPISRTALAGTKIVASIVAASLINVVGAIALGAAHAIRFGEPGLIGGLVIGVLITTAIYVSLTTPLGFLTDRAVIIALAYLFVFENGAAAALGGLATMSPWRIGFAAFGATAGDASIIVTGIVGSLELSVTRGLISVGVAFLLGLLLTTQMLRTRDLA